MMNTLPEVVFQYGLAGLALYMMYSITFNHLTKIQTTLLRIEAYLEHIASKV